MEIIKIIGIGLTALIVIIVLKQYYYINIKLNYLYKILERILF